MIQELLGNSGGGSIDKCMGEERSKMVNPNSGDNTNGGSSSQDHQQQLRCPRCDSSNTKFCYYNNYNLTQPRHFCKTCRRYWTKGGALRNVPIGGGCRKNKSSGTNSGGGSSSANKPGKIKSEPSKSIADHETSSQFLWASGQNSHLFDVGGMAASQQQQALSLALLRASTQNPNPNPNSCSNPNSMVIKEEGLMIGSQQLMSEPVASVLNSQTLTLDHMNQVGIGGGLWRNNSNQQQQQQQQQQQGLFLGEVHGGGIQELYQRLRASASFCNNDYNSHSHSHPHHHHHHHQVLNSSGGSSILDPTPLPSSTELGYWNSPLLSWSDLHTTNGAFP